MGTIISKATTQSGREISTLTTRSNVQVWIYNISATKAIEKTPRPILALSGDRLTTTVLRLRFPLGNIPKSIQDQAPADVAKAELNRHLGAEAYLDSWGARRGEHDEMVVLIRILTASKEGIMRRSGFEDFWGGYPSARYAATWASLACETQGRTDDPGG